MRIIHLGSLGFFLCCLLLSVLDALRIRGGWGFHTRSATRFLCSLYIWFLWDSSSAVFSCVFDTLRIGLFPHMHRRAFYFGCVFDALRLGGGFHTCTGRRFLCVVLEDMRVLERCTLSSLAAHPKARLFRQLLEMFRFYLVSNGGGLFILFW